MQVLGLKIPSKSLRQTSEAPAHVYILIQSLQVDLQSYEIFFPAKMKAVGINNHKSSEKLTAFVNFVVDVTSSKEYVNPCARSTRFSA